MRVLTHKHALVQVLPQKRKPSMTFFRIRLCFLIVCVCVCFGVLWDTVISLHCTDYYPMCQDAIQCMGETLVLIYQHMALIDNPSARGAVGNERD